MIRSNSTTEKLFRNAGVVEGMSILELGCGPGEVSELLSDMVGPDGQVVAVDQSRDMLAAATSRLDGKRNVRFTCGDLNGDIQFMDVMEHGTFDAIVGRRVLMYLSNPAQVLSRLLPWLQDSGLVIFEEVDTSICPGHVADMPAHVQATSLLDRMLQQEGVDRSIGFHLPAIFLAAGLQYERIWAEAIIEGQGDQYMLDDLLELLKPRLESSGVVSASEIESLKSQIVSERSAQNVFLSGMRFCAKAVKGNGPIVGA